MKRLLKRENSEKGMVTIEATIALTSFLFMFITIYSIITICRAQARIQIALNNTAQEISQYSYIYGMSGLDASLKKFQDAAGGTKTEVNGLVKSTIGVFEGIQSLGKTVDEAADRVDISNVDSLMAEWDSISAELKTVGDDASAVKSKIGELAKDPKKFLFGLAKLLGSETLEVAKSRIIAEPVAKALIGKHLKRSESDTAEAFCRSVGIVQGTYLGETTHFNGLDFSSSTLFPYGSEEITLIVTYKVKMLELLPLGLEFTITQSASTKGWLHGDATENSATEIVEAKTKENDEKSTTLSVWNSETVNKRSEIIRSLEVDKLKTSGYSGVSGETYIQAYNEGTNTFAMVSTCNPVWGANSVSEIDKSSVEEHIKRTMAQINSSTDNRQTVNIKVKDDKGNITIKTVDCSESAINKKVVLIVPEDEGVKDYVQNVVNELGYSSVITVEAGYGTGYELPETAPPAEGES